MPEIGVSFPFAYDYGQLYLYDAAREWPASENPYIDALDAAAASGLSVGVHAQVVDVLMPRQENFAGAMEVLVVAEPPAARAAADHVVEFDLSLTSGRLALEGSGGSGTAEVTVEPGWYRARLTGHGFDAAAAWSYADGGNPGDHYLLELWPTAEEQPVLELRRWPGYADRL